MLRNMHASVIQPLGVVCVYPVMSVGWALLLLL